MSTRGVQSCAPNEQDPTGIELLRIARRSIEHGLVHREPAPVDFGELPEALSEPGSTFTTLRFRNELRGCRGSLEATLPLAEDVARTAFQAAFEDPRFAPVGEHEFTEIMLEISVLSPLESLAVTDEAHLLEQLTPGTDGLVIHAHGRRATFLPKVWEMLPDAREFLIALKAKCGLSDDYWSEQLEFQRYQTTSYAD